MSDTSPPAGEPSEPLPEIDPKILRAAAEDLEALRVAAAGAAEEPPTVTAPVSIESAGSIESVRSFERAGRPARSSDGVPGEPPSSGDGSSDLPPTEDPDAAPVVPSEGASADVPTAAVAEGEDVPEELAGPPRDVDVADPDAERLSALPLAVRLEAALFAATEPLPWKRLREVTGCPDARLLRDALTAYGEGLVREGRAFRLEEVAAGFQIRTVPAAAVVVQRLGRRPTEEKLSQAALETLAVVAYRQPVLRVDIERIRGVACGEVLRALQERGLVRVAGRAELPGSPILYGTSQRFLEIFGLKDLNELPKDREVLRRDS